MHADLDPGPTPESGEIPFSPGDVVVAYTDGLVEQPNQPMDVAVARLADTLAAADGDAEQIADALLANCPPTDRAHDDQTLVVITHR